MRRIRHEPPPCEWVLREIPWDFNPHDPNASYAPQPTGVLLLLGADLEPTVPGTTTYEELGWTATDGLVNQPVPTGQIELRRMGPYQRGPVGR